MPNISETMRMRPPRATTQRVSCPHCDAPAVTRSSHRLSPMLREIYYQCSNLVCGHAFVATHEIVRTVTPSQIPRQGVRLPRLAPGTHKPIWPDEIPRPANDDAATIAQPNTG
ncbi:MAG: hypothetical protein RL490_1454 [Pseudomonadota bacterium]